MPRTFARVSHNLLLTTFAVFAALIYVLPVCAQQSSEVISLFRSEIAIAPDSSVAVHETIRVHAAGAAIRHGIFRDFPTNYRDQFGNRIAVGFTVSNVLRDGRPEPYQTETLSNGVRIRIGQADVELVPGDYTYEIFYATSRQLGYFADHDELYWNATGNAWAFPIEHAEALVRMPAGVAPGDIHVEGYTGPTGAKGKDYSASVNDSGQAQFESTHALPPGSGLTIVVSWPKGFVTSPSAAENLHYFFSDNRTALIGLAGLLALLAYYLSVWSAVGRDPAPGPLVVRYAPPNGLSPAGMRYLVRMGFDQTTFAAAILNLAVKRFLTIQQEEGKYILSRVHGAKIEGIKDVAPEERTLARTLFETTDTIVLTKDHYRVMQTATKSVRASLQAAEEKIYFVNNGRYLAPGLIGSAIVLLVALVSLPGQQFAASAFMSVWLTGWSFGVFALTVMVMAGWSKALAERSVVSLSGASLITAFSLPFWAGELFGIYTLVHNGSMLFAALLVALIGTNILFHYLLKAPTRAGRLLLDQVEGFKRFFLAVERDPMQRLSEPEVTPELFEKYLPYAVALGVEKAWTERFTSALTQAGQSPANYSPDWYSGGTIGAISGATFVSGIGAALSSAVASASTAPGSSSGGGGGGSSGGGGGGGGGGGW